MAGVLGLSFSFLLRSKNMGERAEGERRKEDKPPARERHVF